jgi:ABC-type antimicrobial peptide transport system permease subunit
VFVLIVGYQPHPAYMALYFALMILLVFGCVIMSNMYQDIYTGTDEIATRLQEQTIMSYLILYSPFIMAMIAIIGGVLMFGIRSTGDGTFGGGV